MTNPVDNAFAKFLEFLVLAITVGSSIWMSFLAVTVARHTS